MQYNPLLFFLLKRAFFASDKSSYCGMALDIFPLGFSLHVCTNLLSADENQQPQTSDINRRFEEKHRFIRLCSTVLNLSTSFPSNTVDRGRQIRIVSSKRRRAYRQLGGTGRQAICKHATLCLSTSRTRSESCKQ